jgi:hypothetical protein
MGGPSANSANVSDAILTCIFLGNIVTRQAGSITSRSRSRKININVMMGRDHLITSRRRTHPGGGSPGWSTCGKDRLDHQPPPDHQEVVGFPEWSNCGGPADHQPPQQLDGRHLEGQIEISPWRVAPDFNRSRSSC